jgi:DNA-binding CsgD family transcriptional regulator
VSQSSPPLKIEALYDSRAMISTKELSELLAILYAAPLEPQKWQAFLDHLSSLTNISSGYLVGTHPVDGNTVLAGGGLNFDPEVFELYNEHFGANDPYRAPLVAKPRVGLIHGEELVSHAALLRSELYNEVLSRYDLEHMNLLCCSYKDGEADLLSLWRGPKQGRLDVPAEHLLEALVPHIQTAMMLRKKLADCDATRIFSETALDVMSIAAFLVDGKARVRHMNQLALNHLEGAGCVRLNKGRLVAIDHEASSSGCLEQMIAQAASTQSHSLDRAPGGSLKLSQFNVTVVPLPEQNQVVGPESYALVFVTDTRQPARSRSAVMQQLYRLTPSEARVADRLLDGLDVRETADHLGITAETCRFHLKRIFAKTGTRRQAELIRLMLSLPGQ